VATYDYCDAQGTLIYQVLRYVLPDGDKTFKQRRPDGHNRWRWNLQGIDPLPYHLPDVLQAIAAGQTIFLVEGEKDTNNLARLGLTATCNNGGAGHWGAAQSAYLTGAHVALIPDNDQAGRDHVAKAARYLHAAGAASLRIITLPGLRDKGDVSDWLAAGGTPEQLQALLLAAPLYTPPAIPPANVRPATQVLGAYVAHGRLSVWAQRALERRIEDLAHRGPGDHWQPFKAAAFRLGTIAAHGLLSHDAIWLALRDALYANGYLPKHGEHTAEKQFEHYFRRGLDLPCQLPQERLFPRHKNSESNGFGPEKKAESTVDWIPVTLTMLPISWRAALNKYVYDAVAPYLEFCVEAVGQGLAQYGERLTIAQLVDLGERLGRDVSESTLRRAVKVVSAYFLTVCPTESAIQNHENDSDISIGQTARKSTPSGKTPHRPAQTYVIPSPQQIYAGILRLALPRILDRVFTPDDPTVEPIRADLVEALRLAFSQAEVLHVVEMLTQKYSRLIQKQPGLQAKLDQVTAAYQRLERRLRDTRSAPIPPDWKYRNAPEYAACCARALIEGEGGETHYSQRQLAEHLGKSTRRVNSVLNRAGVRAESRTTCKPIPSAEAALLIQPWDNTLKGYAKRVVASKDGQAWHSLRLASNQPVHLDDENLPQVVATALTSGLQVAVEYQQTNRQVISSSVQPERPSCRRAARLRAVAADDDSVDTWLPERPQAVEEGKNMASRQEQRRRRRERAGVGRDPAVAEAWLCKLLALGTSWQRKGDQVVNLTTGEVLPYSPRLVLDLLLEEEPPTNPFSLEYPPTDSAPDEPLSGDMALIDYVLQDVERWEDDTDCAS
jgi:hypothetical protein